MIKFIIRRYGWMLGLASVLSIISAAAGITILAQLNTELKALTEQGVAISKLPIFIGMIVAMVTLGMCAQYLLAKLSAGIVAETRKSIVARILKADYAQVERIGGHKIYAALSGDTARINKGISTIPEYTYSLASVLLSLAYIGYLSLELLGLVLAIIGIAILLVKVLLNRAARILGALRKNDDDLFGQYQLLVEGNKELNINYARKLHFYHKLFLPTASDAQQNTVQSQVNFALISNISNAFVFAAMICLLYGANWLLPHLELNILLGTMLVFLYMVGPLSFVIDSFSSLIDAVIGFRRVQNFEQQLPESALSLENDVLNSNIQFNTLKHDWKTIEFSDVEFEYPTNGTDTTFAIGPINLTLCRGETVFICGGNGSGKSTFAKLLCGLYRPTAGKILVDGVTVNNDVYSLAYRNLFTTIFSDFYLFSDVLDEHGKPAVQQRLVVDLLTDLQMQNKVEVVNGKLSSTQLSHGQRKRLALMQSQLENAPVCLFDEWAADQDPYFRHYFYQTILPRLKADNKLVIAISHDDRYFQHCDRLFKFDQGGVTEISSHQSSQQSYSDEELVDVATQA